MQNQDPTADTDPNEYINQLVQVNSLEQLIDINQTLSGDVGGTSSGSGSGSSAQVPAAPNGTATASPLTANVAAHSVYRTGGAPATASSAAAPSAKTIASGPDTSRAPGNLGVPGVNAAAQKVGHALNGRAHLKHTKGSAIALQ
jgi:flagellar basal-body rod modification protein FlgD